MDGRLPYSPIALCLLLLLCSPECSAATADLSALARQVADAAPEAKVLILGERHGQPESHALFLDLVAAMAVPGVRLLVALEVPVDRDADLRGALAGRPTSEFSVVDSPSFRAMLRELGRSDTTFAVAAMDAPQGCSGPRDEAMAAALGDAARSGRYDRIVALVGNAHALKAVPWRAELHERPRSMAERLLGQGIAAASVVQWFPDESCGLREARFLGPRDEGTSAAVSHLWARMNTEDPPAAEAAAAADGVIVWSCLPVLAKTAAGRP